MLKVYILILVFILAGCSSSYKKIANGYEKDGIIFLNEDEEGKKSSATRSKPYSVKKTTNSENQDQENIRDFKKMDGITYLSYDEQASEQPYQPLKRNRNLETGKASYYAMNLSGRKTASGEIYDPNKLTAAHPSLPFGTRVRVTNLYNRESVIVRINDRGPHQKSRIIDISYAAAKKLDMVNMGICEVAIEIVKK